MQANKEAHALNYFNTLIPVADGRYFLKFYIKDYQHLSFIQESLLKISQSVLMLKADSNESCHTDMDICNLLEVAKNLIPFDEMEYLTLRQREFKKELKQF